VLEFSRVARPDFPNPMRAMTSRLTIFSVLGGAILFVQCSEAPSDGVSNPTPTASASSSSATGGTSGTASVGAATSGTGGAATGGGGGASTTATGGASGTGGAAGASGGAGGAAGAFDAGVSPQFVLLWEDTFDTFDETRWAKATHTFPENLARFATDHALVEGSLLKLRVSNTPNGAQAYSAGEVYTRDTFLYGRFEARIKFARGSGIVSSLFSFKDNSTTFWNEIDIESLGNQPMGVQYNIITSPMGSNVLTYQPSFDLLGFSQSADFHNYAFEWTPTEVRFYVDGRRRYTDARNVSARLTQPARLRMNCWPTNYARTMFAGPLDTAAIPAEAQYDWVRVYRYVP
jgi:hypothetical protein